MPFRSLLQALVDETRGARGAVFCDAEGEHVELALPSRPMGDAAGLGEFELKIYGAHMAAVLLFLQEAATRGGAGATAELRVICAGGTLLCRQLQGGYYLALLLAPGGRTAPATWRLARAAEQVAHEM